MDERIGHYRIVSELGRGGMGVVYKAHEESLNRFVAIKVLGEHLAADPSYVQRFLREAQSAARLNHPNIVHIHLVGEDAGRHYFVMEYVAGTSLQQLLRSRGRLPVQEAGGLVLQAAAGLAAAHDQGVIHRDIKPANLLIDERGLVKIADFGLAFVHEAAQRLTATGVFMGTPGYLSPEQCMEKTVDHRSDIYSLGVSFYETLAGRMPFAASSPLGLLRQILEVEPPDVCELNPAVDQGTRTILTAMMARDRDHRFASCHELIAALQQHLDRLSAAGLGFGDGSQAPVAAPPPVVLYTPAAAAPGWAPAGDAPTISGGGAMQAPTGSPPLTPPPPPAAEAAPAARSRGPQLLAAVLLVAALAVVAAVVTVLMLRGRGTEQPPRIVQLAPTPEATALAAPLPSPAVAAVEASAAPPATATTQAPSPATEVGDNQSANARSWTIEVPTTAPATPTPTAPAAPRPTAPRTSPGTHATAPPATAAVVPTAAPVPTPTAPATPTPVPTADPAGELLAQLASASSADEQYAAKKLYRSFRSEARVQEATAAALLAGFNRTLDDERHVDAMAWLCNILGESGNPAYAAALDRVAREAENRKIRRFAEKNLKQLR